MALRLGPWRDLAVGVVLAFVSVMAGLHIDANEHRALDALGWTCIAVSCAALVGRRRWLFTYAITLDRRRAAITGAALAVVVFGAVIAVVIASVALRRRDVTS